MTKPFTYLPSCLVAMKRIEASSHLHFQAKQFLALHVAPDHFEDPGTYPAIIDTIDQEDLVHLNRALRASITKLRPGKDSSPFWALIDATGFWEDTMPGRWPYMTNVRAEVLLLWACSYVAGQSFIPNERKVARDETACELH